MKKLFFFILGLSLGIGVTVFAIPQFFSVDGIEWGHGLSKGSTELWNLHVFKDMQLTGGDLIIEGDIQTPMENGLNIQPNGALRIVLDANHNDQVRNFCMYDQIEQDANRIFCWNSISGFEFWDNITVHGTVKEVAIP